jgi:hypothetical protein
MWLKKHTKLLKLPDCIKTDTGIIKGIDDHGNNGTFHQKWEITYTRVHAKAAKTKAYEIYESLRQS